MSDISKHYEPLLYAAPAYSEAMLYFGRFQAPDPFLAFGYKGKKVALLNALEINRGHKESVFDAIISLEKCIQECKIAKKGAVVKIADLVGFLAKAYKIPGFLVPADFPVEIALGLKEKKIPFVVKEAPFFPQQMIKTPDEIKELKLANKAAAAGIDAAKKALLKAKIKTAGKLYLDGKLLTSERLRSIIEVACLEAGAVGDCIAAGGDQACDPHQAGHGPLRANELIIIDVFPRLKASGYYGDMTRTFLKGKATEAQKKLFNVVHEAQKKALAKLKAGVKAAAVHKVVEAVFADRCYTTDTMASPPAGFIHSTGHGVGLGLHEPLRVSGKSDLVLKTGMVVTIEPGLYYAGLGGVRIEDVACVTKTGHELLSRYSYQWQLQ